MIDAMANKKDGMTIEDLAGMIQRNIPTKDEMNEEFDKLRTEMSSKITAAKTELRDEIRETRNDIMEIGVKFEYTEDVVRRIDGKDLPNLKRRVTVLETIIKPLIK